MNVETGLINEVMKKIECLETNDLEEINLCLSDKLNEYKDIIQPRFENSEISRKVRNALKMLKVNALKIQLRILLDNENKKYR